MRACCCWTSCFSCSSSLRSCVFSLAADTLESGFGLRIAGRIGRTGCGGQEEQSRHTMATGKSRSCVVSAWWYLALLRCERSDEHGNRNYHIMSIY